MHPTTDIIVLAHNRLSVTQQFVQRLFAHTDNFRLIFVNNGSIDGTTEYLDQGKDRWEVIHHPDNLGVILGRNSATKVLQSEYFINLDNDQLVTNGWLQKLHDCMSMGFDVVGIEAWKLMPPGMKGQVVIHGGSTSSDMSYFPYKKCTKKCDSFTYIGCGGMLIKKTVFDVLGLFDERFSPAYFEDPDFCFRAIQSGFKLGWCSECHIEHLAHQTIGTQRLFDKNQQFMSSWAKFKEKWTPYFPQPIRMS